MFSNTPFLVRRAVKGFNFSRTVILTPKSGIPVEETSFSKMQILNSCQTREEIGQSFGVT